MTHLLGQTKDVFGFFSFVSDCTDTNKMARGVICPIVFLSFLICATNGRLTEITTERLPILIQNLHMSNLDLKAISKRASLGFRSEFRLKNGDIHQTAKGSQRVRLVQTYAGYEVYGPTAVAELDMKGQFTGHLYGEVARNLHEDIPNPEACVRDVKTLLNIAIRLEKLNPGDPNIDKMDGRRVIYADPAKRLAKIVYVVEFFYKGNNFVSSPVYYMDACSYSVLISYNKIRNASISESRAELLKTMGVGLVDFHGTRNGSLKYKTEKTKSEAGAFCSISAEGRGGNPNTGQIFYNTQPYCLNVKRGGFTCTMEGTYVDVIDNLHSEDTEKKTPISFDCTVGYNDAINGAWGVANDAFFYGELTGQFYVDIFKKRALPTKPRLIVHYGRNYDNAFWTGSAMYFGDGKTLFYPLTYIDVIAHELAHGITAQNSNLIYFGRPGGINEAFSDISGMAVTFYMLDRPVWSTGSAILKSGTGALRYFDDPTRDGKSIKNVWRFRPFMEVHRSSGVFNYAFYHMVATYRLHMYVAYAAFLNANRLLWGMFTRYRKAACNVIQAGYDTGSDYISMRKALKKTGLFLFICQHRALKTTLFPGETRENILVSRQRSPILEIDLSHWPGSGLEVSTDINCDPESIRIVLATDGDANNVIAEGIVRIKFPANVTKIHAKLISDHEHDVKVTLKVLN